jgi:1,4-alpha-glucan branching enzyme
MGTEIAQDREWNHALSLDWHLVEDPMRQAFARFLEDLGRLYRDSPCFWQRDPDPDGFAWIDCSDYSQSVISFVRSDGKEHLVVVLNLTPVPREDYRIGAPAEGTYVERFSSDDRSYGGSEFETLTRISTEPVPFHGHPQSIRLRLPPLGVLVLGRAT